MPLVLAFALLTRFPLDVKPRSMRDLAAASAWFPLAGALVAGAGTVALVLGTNLLGRPMGALGAVFVVALVTGGLHLDGLAACIEAALCPGDPARRVQAMRERAPSVLTHGLVALWLVARYSLLAAAASAGTGVAALWAATITSRAVLAAEIYQGPPATSGVGSYAAMHSTSKLQDAVTALAVGILLVAPLLQSHQRIAPALGLGVSLGLLASVLWHAVWRRLIGGLTGDVLGAAVEIREIVLLACFASPLLTQR